jgi:hypothetical protein
MSQILTNPADRKAIKDAIKEISASITRVEAERDLIKEIISNINEQFLLPKKLIRRMAKVYHNQNFTKEQEEHSEFEALYETVVEASNAKTDD